MRVCYVLYIIEAAKCLVQLKMLTVMLFRNLSVIELVDRIAVDVRASCVLFTRVTCENQYRQAP